ncbi:MAG TPA: hypothetical protein VHK28_02905 [Candidatus Limnocylindria bacterium]|nr:hypothetical protein [Candidatus Limnocylindria bacterium]
MTMNHDVHPHDERLAALASDEPEVAGDAALRAHVSACDRCGPMVAEMTALRSALAELPDLVPSRPLQLLPPVPEPAASGAGIGLLRRLWGPFMVAGAGLALVGAIGLSGGTEGLMQGMSAEDAGAPGFETMSSDPRMERATDIPAAPSGAVQFNPDAAGSPAAEGATGNDEGEVTGDNLAGGGESGEGDGRADLLATDQGDAAWWAVVFAGIVLILVALALRFRVQPRAG